MIFKVDKETGMILETKLNFKEKFTVYKAVVKTKVKNGYTWCKNNPESALAIGGVIFSGVCYLGKAAIKRSNIKAEEDVKNLYCYDRSLGHYWKLRRELRNDEWLEIDRRKRNGESLSDILCSMRVLD